MWQAHETASSQIFNARNTSSSANTRAHNSSSNTRNTSLSANTRVHSSNARDTSLSANLNASYSSFSANTTVHNLSSNTLMASGKNTSFLDLHGLHVNEACDILSMQLDNLRVVPTSHHSNHSNHRYLHVCVGTGHHSKGAGAGPGKSAKARLPAAVAQLLTTQGLRFREIQAGLVRIEL
eukprot:gene6793-30761_t